jgi:hypothetical protein
MTDYDFAPRSTAEDSIFRELLDLVPEGATAEQAEERFDWVMSTLPPAPNEIVRAGTERIRARLLHALAGREVLLKIIGKKWSR